jgi:hypothetical protein
MLDKWLILKITKPFINQKKVKNNKQHLFIKHLLYWITN